MLVQGNRDNNKKSQKVLFVSTFGSDNEDLITTISEILYRFKGSFIKSRFNRLNNHFTGVFILSIGNMYLKPFVACLNSLTTDKLHFEFDISEVAASSYVNKQDKVRFEIQLWGAERSGIPLELLKVLSLNQLVIESLDEEQLVSASGVTQSNHQIKVVSDFVVDLDEIELELQELANKLSMNLIIIQENESLQDYASSMQRVG